MFHLFNSVYVDTERRLDRRYDHITISPMIGYEYVHFDKYETALGRQLWYSPSLDNLDPATFEYVFNEALNSDKKTFVYCDNETYLRLYGMLVKAVFPSVDLETFRWILLCKKATFNTTLTKYGVTDNNAFTGVDINKAAIDTLYAYADRNQSAMSAVVKANPEALSLEWRVAHLVATGDVGTLPKTLLNILRRIALANTHDVLDVWGRMITDPANWDYAGCDMQTLLDAPTVFQGAVGFNFTNNPVFLKPGLFELRPSEAWIFGLLEEMIPLLEHCDEGPTAGRSRLVLELLRNGGDWEDPENCLKNVHTMFRGPKRLALPNRDTGKYDENLLRYLLGRESSDLKECFQEKA